ncbi:15677_t:CDS:2, partial [Racocetra fulgida]
GENYRKHPSHYATLYKKCWSSEPNLRPALDEILIELENLSAEPVEFITNNINNQQMPQSNISSHDTNSVSPVNTPEDHPGEQHYWSSPL